jgi:hypothetical protein
METAPANRKKRRTIKKVLLWSAGIFFSILLLTTIYISRNFNQLLSDALIKGFNANSISDIYELKFEKLRVNIFAGNIKVYNVLLEPRKKPGRSYPYINSSFRLETRKIILEDVQFVRFIKTGKFELKRIEINKPDIQLWLNGENRIFLPYKDTLAVKSKAPQNSNQFINSFTLKEFELVDASIHSINKGKGNEFKIDNLTISFSDLVLAQYPGRNSYSIKNVGLTIAGMSGAMQKGGFRNFKLKDLNMSVTALDIQKSIDTLTFTYGDFNTDLKDLTINTADSIFNLTLQSIDLSFAKKSINLAGFAFKPNLSQAEMLKREKYQKAQFSVSVGSLNLVNVNFDTLVYSHKVFVDEIKVAKVDVSLFKDKSKPVDRKKFPQYLAQKIKAIPVPLRIKIFKTTGLNFVSVERKEDGKTAKVTVQRGSVEVKNITNLPSTAPLSLNASAYLENKASLSLAVAYRYDKPQFSINGKIGKFNLPDLNSLVTAYSPAKINKGTVDEITFSGTAYRTKATGTLTFLYHNLDIDLKLTDKKWQNSAIAFAANTYLNTNNPPSAGKPPRIVAYQAERDMNKGGFNIILKSFLAGMKETMIMSKENKKAYKEVKKKWKLKGK